MARFAARSSNDYGRERADTVRIIYGGSVNDENVDSLVSKPDIDGALVGGASLKADSFARIVRARTSLKKTKWFQSSFRFM